MAAMLLLLFASAVLTAIFWTTVMAAALAILQILLAIVRGIFWLITRPIVWLVVIPLHYLFGGSRTPAPVTQQIPATAPSTAASSSTEKLQQLSKLKALHNSGAITQAEFDRLKRELLTI